MARDEFSMIRKALKGKRVGEIVNVHVGPGRGGLITVKKGAPASGSGFTVPLKSDKKSKVIPGGKFPPSMAGSPSKIRVLLKKRKQY